MAITARANSVEHVLKTRQFSELQIHPPHGQRHQKKARENMATSAHRLGRPSPTDVHASVRTSWARRKLREARPSDVICRETQWRSYTRSVVMRPARARDRQSQTCPSRRN